MVDGDKHAMGFIYEAMDQAKEAIKKGKSIFLFGISLMTDGTDNSIVLCMQLAIT